jgi:hypothetical protein
VQVAFSPARLLPGRGALDAKGRYRIGGDKITPRCSYLDQGGTTPLLRAYAIDCPRCSC